MSRFACTHGISHGADSEVAKLRLFSSEGYRHCPAQSSGDRLVFTRAAGDIPAPAPTQTKTVRATAIKAKTKTTEAAKTAATATGAGGKKRASRVQAAAPKPPADSNSGNSSRKRKASSSSIEEEARSLGVSTAAAVGQVKPSTGEPAGKSSARVTRSSSRGTGI